jgi:energy-coupling factor transporter transmembrane protein EcfT
VTLHNYSVLFCSVLFCSVLFCSVLFYSILFCSVLFCSVLFCSVLFCSVLFCSVLFCSVLFCSVLFCSVLFSNSILPQCSHSSQPVESIPLSTVQLYRSGTALRLLRMFDLPGLGPWTSKIPQSLFLWKKLKKCINYEYELLTVDRAYYSADSP